MDALRSPNFGPRRDGLRPNFVVLHYTAMASLEEAVTRLCSPEHEVSAHYVISKTGKIVALVDEKERAWHAGAGTWQGLDDMNSRSIGIELDNTGVEPFSEPLMGALEELLRGILERWSIPPANVIGHSDLAPGRKQDPGARFDWERLALEGLAAAGGTDPGPRNPTPELFFKVAQHAGYPADVPFEPLLHAVRLRFRPWAQGALAPEDFTPLGARALWT
ncbi:MAG: N-acetylmuramoyl-L-alanine amidase [Pseudomonadota bacterium]